MKKLTFIMALILSVSGNSIAQHIYTAVGGGTSAPANGVAAGSVDLGSSTSLPLSVKTDSHCNLYFATLAGDIWKVDKTTGLLTKIAGIGIAGVNSYGSGGPATAAQLAFSGPSWFSYGQHLFIDGSDNIYTAENFVVRRIDAATGIITTVAGNGLGGGGGDGGQATAAGMNPTGVVVDGSGNIYISDYAAIRKVNTSGIISTIVGDGATTSFSGIPGPATAALIGSPTGILIDGSGNIIFVDEFNNSILKIDPSGNISLIAGQGNIWGATYTPSGPATAAYLSGPTEIALDPSGNLYVNERGSAVVQKINTSGNISTLAGAAFTTGYAGDNGPAASAKFYDPFSLCIDQTGNIYISDYFNYRIRVVPASNSALNGSISVSPGLPVKCGKPITLSVTFEGMGCSGGLGMYGSLSYKWYRVGNATPVGTGSTFTETAMADGEQFYCVITGYWGSYTTPKITITLTSAPKIADVDINSICVPGSAESSSSVVPVYSVTVGGGAPPYTYTWAPVSGNSSTLDYSPAIGTATVTASNSPYKVKYLLTVTDINGCSSFRPVFTQLITSGFDLASRDSHDDMYDEPNTQNTVTGNWDIWDSPDIWNRYILDGDVNQVHLPPHYGIGDNYVYVKVRNVGCASSPSTAVLNTYWTIGGFPETWSFTPGQNDWTDHLFPGTTLPQGLQITTTPIPIPVLAPGTNVILHAAWAPPNPNDYYTGATSMELCFLARTIDGHYAGHTDGMTYEEIYGIGANVGYNNNIVTRNTTDINVSNPSSGPQHHFVIAGNAESSSRNFNIQFANSNTLGTGITSGSSTMSGFISITVYLGDLFDVWQEGGGQGVYAAISSDERSVTFDCNSTMELDNINIDAFTEYLVSFVVNPVDGADLTNLPDETLYFRQILNGDNPSVYGCYNYHVFYDPSGAGRPSAPTDNAALQKITAYPNPAKTQLNFAVRNPDDLSISLMDITGRTVDTRILHNQKHAIFNIADYAPGVYLYKVRYSDGKEEAGKITITH